MLIEQKKLLIECFILAGIAFYSGGSWKEVFRTYMRKDKHLLNKLKPWMIKGDASFRLALDKFFDVGG